MDSSSEKSIRLPTFSGEHKDFQIWWMRFRAYANVHGFAVSIQRKADINLPESEDAEIDETTDVGKKQAKAKKMNAIAMANLTMAFTTEALMGIVNKAVKTEWPSGLAYLVIDALFKKYVPQDLISMVELRKALNSVTMKKTEDPANLFEALSGIENKYNTAAYQIPQTELIATVLEKAPAEYSSVITSEQRHKGDSLQMSDLSDAMNQLWRTMYGKSDDSSKDTEIGLFNGSGDIVCYRCKKKGHKAFQCPDKNKDKKAGGGQGKFTGKCKTCGKSGYRAADCFDDPKNADKVPSWYKKKKDDGVQNHNETGMNSVEVLLQSVDEIEFPKTMKLLFDPNVWIADTGASVDSTGHAIGTINKRVPRTGDGVTNGNGEKSTAQIIADIPAVVCNKKGMPLTKIKMTDVKIVPDNKFNLFSITKRMKQGWSLHGDDKAVKISKGGVTLTFDIRIETTEGLIFAMYAKRSHGSEIGGVGTDGPARMSIQKAHDLLGHTNEDMTRATAKALGWEITRGSLGTCESCAAGKAKQKNVPKASEHAQATMAGERIFLDISTIKGEKDGPKVNAKKNWRIMVDERTNMKFTKFFTTKNGMIEPTLAQLERWRQAGIKVKYIRCDNAGENKKLEERSDSADWKMGLRFEYTARDTPQQNHLAELGFAVLANRGRAMMYRANVPKPMRYQIFPKAFETATLQDGLVVVEIDGKKATRYEHFAGKLPKFAQYLRTWGEAGTVTVRKKMSPKLADRGITCMFVGYATNHDGDCYEMLDPTTGTIYVSRDIIWLKRMYYVEPVTKVSGELVPYPVEDPVEQNQTDEATLDVADADDNDPVVGEGETQEDVEVETPTTRSGRRVQTPSYLDDYETGGYQISLTPAEERFYATMRELNELALYAPNVPGVDEMDELDTELNLVGAALGGGFTHTSELKPKKYKEAMKTGNREKWDAAVDEEHRKFQKYNVWKAVSKDKVPRDAKVLTSTWAMKLKTNGEHRARLNARGYEQVDGEHYHEDDKAAPVVNDITVRMMFVLIVMGRLWAELLDVNGAFLNGRFQNGEELYMNVPEGFEKFYPSNVLLLLLRTVYGLKQAAMQYWREMVKAFTYMQYERNKADPCLYFKWVNEKLVFWITWVDDCVIAGPKERVTEAKHQMMKLFDCEELGEMKEYVGCKVEYNREEGYMKLTQPVMIQSFSDEFELPEDGNSPRTPAEPGSVLSKGEERNLVKRDRQKFYRSGVGKLLHMMRWTRPEILNAVRETSKFMSGAVEGHVTAMKRIMLYCVGTPKRGLLLKPKGLWDGTKNFVFELEGKSDSEYAKDESRRSVNGWSTFLCEAPISMRSKMMPIVALSVTEAELFSATLCAQDLMFEMRVLQSMGLTVKLPMTLYVDNKGAKDLCDNWSVGGRTRHVEVKQYFLRELKESGFINVVWQSGEDMTSDLFTKNLHGPLFERHASKFVGVDEYMRHENHEGRVLESDSRESRVQS